MNEFDNKAALWDNDPTKVERANFFSQEIIAKIPISKQMTAFEYGCGTGLLSFNLQSYFKEITLADNSDGMLAVLNDKIKQSKLSHFNPIKINLEEKILTNQKYDFVFSMLVMHHIVNIDITLINFYNLLNKNGYLCIIDLDKEDGLFHDKEFIGHFGFEPNELSKQIKNAGFVNVKHTINYSINKQMLDGTIKAYPVFMMTAQKQ